MPNTALIGKLAKEYCDVELPLQVVNFGGYNPYYIGTYHPEEGPVSRESVEYWSTYEEARAALESGHWTQRLNP